jgi:hypothetical protein
MKIELLKYMHEIYERNNEKITFKTKHTKALLGKRSAESINKVFKQCLSHNRKSM